MHPVLARVLEKLLINMEKLPLVNPADTPADQGDVVHFGIQEGKKETLLYSGVFVESRQQGISVGGGKTIKAITN